MIGIHQQLQSGATTGNGNIVQLDGECERLTVYLTTDTGVVSGGAITMEEAPSSTYTGTWAAMVSDSTGTGAISLTQGTTIVRHYTGTFGAVRARFSTNLSGGALATVDLFGYVAS